MIMASKYSKFWGIFPLFVVLAGAFYLNPSSLEFQEGGLKNLPMIFGYLVLIALFVERAIEVFLSAWRSAGADDLDRKIEIKNNDISNFLKLHTDARKAAGKDEYRVLNDELAVAETIRAQYRADSRFISQWFGLGIGIVIAFVGVRVLDSVVDSTSLSGVQKSFFVLVDIMLTGAVIAGGSESINKIMKLYNSFMESTVRRTKA